VVLCFCYLENYLFIKNAIEFFGTWYINIRLVAPIKNKSLPFLTLIWQPRLQVLRLDVGHMMLVCWKS
jgi:hypothetical protein